jgi:hypothetical protein
MHGSMPLLGNIAKALTMTPCFTAAYAPGSTEGYPFTAMQQHITLICQPITISTLDAPWMHIPTYCQCMVLIYHGPGGQLPFQSRLATLPCCT